MLSVGIRNTELMNSTILKCWVTALDKIIIIIDIVPHTGIQIFLQNPSPETPITLKLQYLSEVCISRFHTINDSAYMKALLQLLFFIATKPQN